MDKLMTLQEVQALGALIQKAPMSPAEGLWANMFVNRLFAYASPKPAQPKKDPSLEKSETINHGAIPERPDLEGASGPETDLDTEQPGPDAA